MNKKPSSIIKGDTFSFDIEGTIIDAWYSPLSGLEKVFVNGELVSSRRSFSTRTTNTFKVGEYEYSTTRHKESLLRGPIVCTLKKDGIPIKRKKLIFPMKTSDKKGKLIFGLELTVMIILFGLIRLSVNYYNLSENTHFKLNIILVFAIVIYEYISFKKTYREPYIEDEEIV